MASDSMIAILTDLVDLGCNFGADVLGYRAAWMKFTPGRRVYWTGHITAENDFLVPLVWVWYWDCR